MILHNNQQHHNLKEHNKKAKKLRDQDLSQVNLEDTIMANNKYHKI